MKLSKQQKIEFLIFAWFVISSENIDTVAAYMNWAMAEEHTAWSFYERNFPSWYSAPSMNNQQSRLNWIEQELNKI